MSCLRLLAGGMAAVSALALHASPSGAQDLRAFSVPAGPLGDALPTFATQSGLQILYTSEMVAGRTTSGLQGRHEPQAGLARLLTGSGLSWTQTRPGVLVLRRESGVSAIGPATQLEEVVVTGSLLKTSGELASPVLMLDRDELDRRGRGTVAEILTDLPQNYSGGGTPGALLAGADGDGGNGAVATGVNLRGLGPDATLVLVNGRRMAGTGYRGEFADVSALPSAAVERVDVLLDGASALYGSDAVAGVVNIIMRRSFDGQESRFRASAAAGGAETVQASHLIGRSWTSGSALISYEYQHQNAISALDRPYTATGDLRPFGGSDWRGVFSSPGNLVDYDPVLASYVATYAIRPGPTGTATSPADFVAGSSNLQATSYGADLSPQTERHSVYGRVRQSLGDRLDVSADLRFSRRTYRFENLATSTIFDVTDANPFFVSPTGTSSHTMAYSFYGDLGTTRQIGNSRSLGVTAGTTYDVGGGWSVEGYLAYAEERGEANIVGRVNTLLLDEALGNIPDNPASAYSPGVYGYFNPYGSGSANSQALLDILGSGYSREVDESTATSANLLLEGPVMRLPGGDLQVAVGAQIRNESLKIQSSALVSSLTPVSFDVPKKDRTISALFAEARIPIFGPDNARPGLRVLEFSLAGRVEEYEDFGRTANPKLGVVWSPVRDLSLRASYGTSFRAPALPQLYDDSAVGATLVPRANGTRLLAIYLYGGNRDLQPETADTYTAGFDYAPESGLRLSASYFDTEFTNRIAQPASENLDGILTDPSLAPFVRLVDAANSADDRALVMGYITTPGFVFGTLFPPSTYGAILDGRWVNAASVRLRGLDLAASYPMVLGRGTVTFDATASYLLSYESQNTPTAQTIDVLDRVGYPNRLRSRAGVVWSSGPVTADLHWLHVSSYGDGAGQHIDAWDTADATVTWSPSDPWWRGLQVGVTVQNLFDRKPPFYDSPRGYGFDPGQANLLGRVVALQLTKRW
jgi:iron complex outermembrane receptor protein